MADGSVGGVAVTDTVRLGVLAGLAPDRVDAERLVEALETPDDRAGDELARGLAAVAVAHPASVAPHRHRIVDVLAEERDYRIPLYRALGATAGVPGPHPTAGGDGPGEDERRSGADRRDVRTDDGTGVVEFLTNQLLQRRPVHRNAAAAGLAAAAEADPQAVASVSPDPLSVLRDPGWNGSRTARSSLDRVLAALYAADADGPDGRIRPRIEAILESDGLVSSLTPSTTGRGPPPKTAAVGAVSLAAADGCPAAVDALDRVVEFLSGSPVPALGPDAAVVDAVIAGLDAVAEDRPAALVDHTGSLLEARTERLGPDVEPDLWSILARVAVESDPVFTTLLDEVTATAGSPLGIGSIVGSGERYRAVLSVAAAERSSLLAERRPAVETVFEAHPETGADLVGSVAREDPSAVEWAVDPLLERALDGYQVEGRASTLDALGILAATYPRIASRCVADLRGGDSAGTAVRACQAVAEASPGALASAGAVDAPVGALFEAARRGDDPERALRAAAALGRAVPSALEPFVDDVSGLVLGTSFHRMTPQERAAIRLGDVAVRTDPEGMATAGETLFDLVERGGSFQLLDASEDLDGLAALLGAFAWASDRFAGTVLDWFDEVAADRRRTLLSVLAAATWAEGTAVADHLPALLATTAEVPEGDRPVATRALAGALADVPDPPDGATARLVDRCYDPDPAVRRWAAFGLGEWLATVETPPGDPVDRLTVLADATEDTPAATLALVRAGERDPGDHLPVLERAALCGDRAIALSAVGVLSSPGTPAAREALDRVHRDAIDGWVRAAAWRTRKN